MEMIEIKKGGKYRVLSNSGAEEPIRTEGEFIGYTVLGEEGAVVFRVKTGKKTFLRMLPVSGIFSVEFDDEDLLKTKEETAETEKMNYIN